MLHIGWLAFALPATASLATARALPHALYSKNTPSFNNLIAFL